MFGSFTYGHPFYGEVRAATIILQARIGDVILIVVGAEDRVIGIMASPRSITILADDRAFTVTAQDRAFRVGADRDILVDDTREPQ